MNYEAGNCPNSDKYRKYFVSSFTICFELINLNYEKISLPKNKDNYPNIDCLKYRINNFN